MSINSHHQWRFTDGSSSEWQAGACGKSRSNNLFGLEDGSTAESRSALNDPVTLYCH
ncbi:MAG: hypothetical protein V3U62_10180 [Sedimenticolaceae bacterium]